MMLLDASFTIPFGEEGGFQTVGDVFANGGLVFILGMLTVFAVLAILWGCLEVFHRVVHGAVKEKKAPAPKVVFSEPTVTAPAVTASTSNNDEIVAVIAAAVAAAQAEAPTGKFRVVSFRKK